MHVHKLNLVPISTRGFRVVTSGSYCNSNQLPLSFKSSPVRLPCKIRVFGNVAKVEKKTLHAPQPGSHATSLPHTLPSKCGHPLQTDVVAPFATTTGFRDCPNRPLCPFHSVADHRLVTLSRASVRPQCTTAIYFFRSRLEA